MVGEAGTLTRRFSLASLVAVAFVAFALADAQTAAGQEVADANCPGPSDGSLFTTELAQSFTALNTGKLTRAQVSVINDPGSNGDFVLSIHTVDASGVPTNTELATTTIPAADLPLTSVPQTIEGVFAAPADVVAGQQYALVVSRTGDTGVGTPFRFDAPCPGGALYTRHNPNDPFGGTGWDLLFAVFVTLTPGSASQVQLTCKREEATHVGTPDSEVIEGTNTRDVIIALGGNDTIRGGDGDDLICGNRGRDQIRGQAGEDKLFGSRGKDQLVGGAGADLLVGGAHTDSLFGGAGKDRLRGGSPNAPPEDAPDLCRGGSANDKLNNCER